MPELLDAIEFREPVRARRDVAEWSGELTPEVQQQIEMLLRTTADPDRAVHYLAELHKRQPDAFRRLAGVPARLQYLVTVFSYSRFLSDEILQNPQWVEQIRDLDRVISSEEYADRLTVDGPRDALALALFRRQQILRILLRDVLGFGTLAEITEELSNLADAILDVTYRQIRSELVARHGTPRFLDESGRERECGMAVIALGKLGGRELNYSSDVDLMFVYTANGETDGPAPISNKEFYKKVANQYTELLSTYTSEGLCYRVDLRLRPDGSLGEICISLEGARRYYQNRGRDWELQMLIKARAAAGDRETGRELLDSVEPLIYSSTLDFSAVEAVSVTRERIGEKLGKRRGAKAAAFDVKLAPGGIRDIEFLVQCLQRLHGGRVPWVRHGGTLLALARLSDKDLLSEMEYGRLVAAYRFLRNLEHRLQFADDRQTHTLPTDPAELDLLAAKMPAPQLGRAPSGDKLLRELHAHLDAVQDVYQRAIHAQQPVYYSISPPMVSEPHRVFGQGPAQASTNLVRFLDQTAPRLAAVVARSPLRRGARAFEHFLEKVIPNPHWLSLLDESAALSRYILDIFEHSPYFSDELIRTPELLEDASRLHEAPSYAPLGPLLDDVSDLRRLFRREMFRIQAASMCLSVPIFETLEATSDLADWALGAAYRMAVDQTAAAHPPAQAGYPARAQMMVIALGRLGLREFDLASDADLVFILPDEDAAEQVFWTKVAGRMIDLLTAYTSDGVMFAVDTRLRPNGASGSLVQSESSYKEYFSRSAEAWEGISYMKSRAVAGDPDRATRFLTELQQVDWRRYGQSGRSKKDLRQMRLRLEREHGPENPLKAAEGGFYDIDFALLYLRLKSAGIFYPVLNTPARIDIIEKMGHLERADAEFLRDAATFYRAVDHGLRVYSGHTEGNLPSSETQLEVLTELVRRWTPEHLSRQPLEGVLTQIRGRTRDIFDKLFS
jgi:glutamate-ammonia-ligase adenylyltransferase